MASKAKQQLAQRAASTPATNGGGGERDIRQLIEAQKPAFARALTGTALDPERFTRIALTEIRRTPALLGCNPESVLGALMLSAQLGLEPGPLGHAYLVPFKRECTFIIGYRGMIDLARRSGTIESIVAREIQERDEFEFEYGLEEKLVHRPDIFADRGPVVAYYGVAKYQDGGHTILVMSKADIEKFRGRSKAKNNGPWVTDYDAMAKKTVVRRMFPFLPVNVEAAWAVAADEYVVPPTIDITGDVVEYAAEHNDQTPDDGDPDPAEPADDQGSDTPQPSSDAQRSAIMERAREAGLIGEDGEVSDRLLATLDERYSANSLTDLDHDQAADLIGWLESDDAKAKS